MLEGLADLESIQTLRKAAVTLQIIQEAGIQGPRSLTPRASDILPLQDIWLVDHSLQPGILCVCAAEVL